MRSARIAAAFAVIFMTLAGQSSSSLTPAPAPDCLLAVNASGDGAWYCGDVVRIPRDLRVVAPMPACVEEDGSGGPLPCYWAGTQRGNRRGDSFTVIRGNDGLLFRYNNGVTVVAPA